MRTRISIVVPVFDGAPFLARTLESVERQEHDAWECLIVDDGSRDDSLAIAEAWRRSVGARARVLRHEGGANRGAPETRNLALAHAAGELVAFVDQDDLWHPGKLAIQEEFLRAHDEVEAVSCWPELLFEGSEDRTCVELWAASIRNPVLTEHGRPSLRSFLAGCPFFLSGAMAWRASVLAVGGFRAALPRISDWFLWAALSTRGPLAILPEELATYRVHGRGEMAGIASEPLGLALAMRDLHAHLADWLARRRGEDPDQVARALRERIDWRASSRALGIGRADWWRLMAPRA
jgi:glycosyltransferase involved in cell wall biosynthesis